MSVIRFGKSDWIDARGFPNPVGWESKSNQKIDNLKNQNIELKKSIHCTIIFLILQAHYSILMPVESEVINELQKDF